VVQAQTRRAASAQADKDRAERAAIEKRLRQSLEDQISRVQVRSFPEAVNKSD
jgi:hypothetical protein